MWCRGRCQADGPGWPLMCCMPGRTRAHAVSQQIKAARSLHRVAVQQQEGVLQTGLLQLHDWTQKACFSNIAALKPPRQRGCT